MATIDNTTSEVVGDYGVIYKEIPYTFAAAAAGTVVQMFNVENGTRILDIELTQAALGGTGTLIVGDDTDPNGFIVTTTANTAKRNRLDGAYALASKEYTADDTIDLTVQTAAVTGLVTLHVWLQRTYN